MNEFFVSLIFIGIVLISTSLIMILLDKKKAFSFINNYEKKKQELVEIIYDAEQMIEELNKFSDYVVTQMDFKNEELSMNLKKAHEEIHALTHSLKQGNIGMIGIHGPIRQEKLDEEVNIPLLQELAVNGSLTTAPPVINDQSMKPDIDLGMDNISFDNVLSNLSANSNLNSRKEKVIPINNKYSEVVRLFKAGMDNADIAKRLNMGKGEVQLILELNK